MTSRFLGQHSLVVAALAAGVAISVLSFIGAPRWEWKSIRLDFQRHAATKVWKLRNELKSRLDDVRILKVFWGSRNQVEFSEFRHLAAQLMRGKASMQALEWIPLLHHWRNGLYREIKLRVAYCQWLVVLKPTPGFIASSKTWAPAGLLFVCLILTGILAAYLSASIRRAKHIVQVMKERTRELDEVNASLKLEIDQRKDVEAELQKSHTVLEHRVAELAERTRELKQSRAAALNMMQDAVEASEQLRQANTNLMLEITEHKRVSEALQESQLLYNSLVENLPQHIFRKDKDSRFTFGNKKFCASLGQPLEAIMGKTDLDVYPPELAQKYQQDDQAVMATGKILDQVEEHQDPGAVKTYVHVVKTPLRDSTGHITGVQGIFWDVTREKQAEEELKAALAEKEVLLQEVHHRVKNNLQAVIHLIGAQLERVTDGRVRDSLKGLQEQARTMALVHERLYQAKDLARIEIGNYLQDLAINVLEAFGEGRDLAVEVKAAKVWLDVEMAMPIGLIVNELLTNALKHAFPPGHPARGQIWVELRAEGETCTLVVSDNGVGLAPGLDWRKAGSMGLRLVQLWATHQLGGRLEVETRQGTAVTVVFVRRKSKEKFNG